MYPCYSAATTQKMLYQCSFIEAEKWVELMNYKERITEDQIKGKIITAKVSEKVDAYLLK